MNTNFDCLIVGGGPAGVSAAMELVHLGWKVLVVDRAAFPREKVCGGFVGPENRALLQQFGVWDDLLASGAQKVTRLFLSAPNGESVDLPIGKNDNYALGFSRKMFDGLLMKRAQELGVVFKDMTLLKDQKQTTNFKQATLCDLRTGHETRFYFKHSIFAGGALNQSAKAAGRLFGVAALFDRCHQMNSDVIMHFIDQGHAGINRFEGDKVNVCYVIKEELFKRFHGNYGAIWNNFLDSNSWIREQMGDARQLSPWKGTFADMDRPARFMDSRGFLVGDAASVIHPLAGGGISIALKSGVLLGRLLSRTDPEVVDLQVVSRDYERFWNKSFRMQTITSKWIGNMSHQAGVANLLIKLLKSQQVVLPRLFDLFHSSSELTLKESL